MDLVTSCEDCKTKILLRKQKTILEDDTWI